MDELNAFLASREVDNVVVIVQFAKVKTFQGIRLLIEILITLLFKLFL